MEYEMSENAYLMGFVIIAMFSSKIHKLFN